MQVFVTAYFCLILGVTSVLCYKWHRLGDYEYLVSATRVNKTEAKNNCSLGGLAEVSNENVSLFISNITESKEFYWTSEELGESKYNNSSCVLHNWYENGTAETSIKPCSFIASFICQRFCNASWSVWSSWSNCSSNCNGIQNRTRLCISCNGIREGKCFGSDTEVQLCNDSLCSTAPISTTTQTITTTADVTTIPNVLSTIPEAISTTRLTSTTTTSIDKTPYLVTCQPTTPVSNPSFNGGSFAIGFFIPLVFFIALSIKHYMLLVEVKGKWIGWPLMKQNDNSKGPGDSKNKPKPVTQRNATRISVHDYEDIKDTGEVNDDWQQESTPSRVNSCESYTDYEPVTRRYENVVSSSYVNIHVPSTSEDTVSGNNGVFSKSDGYEEPLPMTAVMSNHVQRHAISQNAVPFVKTDVKPKPIPLKPNKPGPMKLSENKPQISNINPTGKKPLLVVQKKASVIKNTEGERNKSIPAASDLKKQLVFKLPKGKAASGTHVMKPSQVAKSNEAGIKTAIKSVKADVNSHKKSSEGIEDYNIMLKNLKPVINRPKD